MHKATNYTTTETPILYSQEPLILTPEWRPFQETLQPRKGPESILLGCHFTQGDLGGGGGVSFLLKQRWVCSEWKGKRPPRSPTEKSGSIRETSHKVRPDWAFNFAFSSSVFVLKVYPALS